MGIFDRLFGRRTVSEETQEPKEYPWDHSPSIYGHIQAHIQPDRNGLTDGGETLPDEERLASESQIRWAAGAMDGVLSHHMGGWPDEDNVKALLDLVQTCWTTPTVKNKADVYDFVVEKGIVSVIDSFIEQLTQREDVNHDRLYDLAHSFAFEAPDREPVKFAIALLGLYGQSEDLEIFRTLGRHDEFTLFCAVAVSNVAEDGEMELWEFAKNVDGWGRIQIVERLAGTEKPEIKEWMLRDGYKNSVMYEYLAYTCATTGGLLEALSQDEVDDQLLTSAAEIIQALIIGGPAECMDDFEDGAVVAQQFLDHVEQHGKTLTQFLTVASIRDYLSNDKADWETLSQSGWTDENRSAMREQCEAIISKPTWRDHVMDGLGSADEQEFYNADQAAQVLGIDTWEFHWERIQQEPLDPVRWFHVMKACNEDRIDDAIALAEQHIPSAEIATGPGNEMGLGPRWEAHSCLDCILQELGDYPGHGAKFVVVGLRSPVIRNRNMALKVLSEWGEENWPEWFGPVLDNALRDEPEEDVRERIERVIKGEPLDEHTE